MKKHRKKILLGLLLLLIGIQFIRPEKNDSGDFRYAIYTRFPMPREVSAIIKPACLNCHSNLTKYPWYAEIQPIGLWLASHVKEGKKHLNFGNFAANSLAYQYHKFEEIIEVVKEEEMPLKSYTWLHKEADISPEQRSVLISWAQGILDTMQVRYPADSLIMKRRKK